jgi:transketolase
MRIGFANTLLKLAEEDSSVYLLVGDIGYQLFDEYVQKFGERFINCGIAEQNMISVAAGLSSAGKKVFVYTIIPFLLMRAYEQIRVDVGINCTNIVLVGVGAGLAYDKLGPTHHAYEDIALMRSIPRMKILTPYDRVSTKASVIKSYRQYTENPSYIRLSKGGEPELKSPTYRDTHFVCWESPNKVDFVIIAHGAILSRFVNEPMQHEKRYAVVGLTEICTDSVWALLKWVERRQLQSVPFIVCEEHYKTGSFFELFSSCVASKRIDLILKEILLPCEYRFEVSCRDSMLDALGYNIETVLGLIE